MNLMVGWRVLRRRSRAAMDDGEPMKMKKRSSMNRFRCCMLGMLEMMQSRWWRNRLAYGGAIRHPIAVPKICR